MIRNDKKPWGSMVFRHPQSLGMGQVTNTNKKKTNEHCLSTMTKTECGFCEDQKRGRIVKSSHKIEALKQSDQLFIRRLKGRDDTAATTF